MSLPPTDRSSFDEALERFDTEFRSTADWADWETNRAHRYAIRANGRLYPVKKVISIATGVTVDRFSGGREANNFVKAVGFEIEATQLPPEK